MTFEGFREKEQARLSELIKEAEAGDPGAQLELAQAYDPECFNEHIVPSEAEAIKWYRKAADSEEYLACCKLGQIYKYGGYGEEKDLETAAMWYRKAIDMPNYDDYEARMDLLDVMEEIKMLEEREVSEGKPSINIDSLLALSIPNLAPITESRRIIGVRGMTLSSSKNRKYLKEIKAAGIDTVIDLRSADHTHSFLHACEAAGLEYRHFPIDKSHTSDTEIIKNLPLLIDINHQGGFYIACAQGLHRTDIALSLYYLFDPKAQEPPMLLGHIKNGTLRVEDIFRRANSVYRSLSAEDRLALGLDVDFDRIFVSKKHRLIRDNEILYRGFALS